MRRQRAVGAMPPVPLAAAAVMDEQEDMRPPSPVGAAPPPPMLSPFANRFQAQIASVMRTMSSRPEEEDPDRA
jgi:hypothetical protein